MNIAVIIITRSNKERGQIAYSDSSVYLEHLYIEKYVCTQLEIQIMKIKSIDKSDTIIRKAYVLIDICFSNNCTYHYYIRASIWQTKVDKNEHFLILQK